VSNENVQAKEDVARLLARSDVSTVHVTLDDLGVRWATHIRFNDKSGALVTPGDTVHQSVHRALLALGEESRHCDCGHDVYRDRYCAIMGCPNYVNKHNARA
jgi:hypothetical protein